MKGDHRAASRHRRLPGTAWLRPPRIFDQGALIALWGEALAFPSAWEGRDDVGWRPLDHDSAVLVVAGPAGDLPITVRFDPSTGFPGSCEAERYKADGPKVGWRGMTTEWRRFDQGVLAPGRFQAQWADEPVPWIDIRTDAVRVNVDIEADMALGRRALPAS
jgi:hypothetical protein